MPRNGSPLWEIAQLHSAARERKEEVMDYESLADLFHRWTLLDTHSKGPELARLQTLSRHSPPQPVGAGGRLRALVFRILNPPLGRLLRAASLASPYQAAYDLVLQIQQQQFETERALRTEVAALRDRLDVLESELRSNRASV